MNTTIKAYLDKAPIEVRFRLTWIYNTIKKHLTPATETFAYQMPTFKGKHNLIHFAYYSKHIGIYPGPKGILFLQSIDATLMTSKGTWQIPHDQPLPKKVFSTLCRWIKQTQDE
ncbi:MAG: iron chaperone [Bacilli bacterium]